MLFMFVRTLSVAVCKVKDVTKHSKNNIILYVVELVCRLTLSDINTAAKIRQSLPVSFYFYFGTRFTLAAALNAAVTSLFFSFLHFALTLLSVWSEFIWSGLIFVLQQLSFSSVEGRVDKMKECSVVCVYGWRYFLQRRFHNLI